MNPQPPLLESGALPIELLAYERMAYRLSLIIPRQLDKQLAIRELLLLLVQRVLAAARTELVELDAARIVAAILLRRVVALFALGARQRDDRPNIFLCHCNCSFL